MNAEADSADEKPLILSDELLRVNRPINFEENILEMFVLVVRERVSVTRLVSCSRTRKVSSMGMSFRIESLHSQQISIAVSFGFSIHGGETMLVVPCCNSKSTTRSNCPDIPKSSTEPTE